jgi:hypothetical protein
MSKSTRSLIDEIDARPTVDNQQTFDTLWAILGDLFEKVSARFELNPDPSTASLQPYEAVDGSGAGGYLSTFAGPEIDWLVFSWVGNPKMSFTNMHLTVSLAAHLDAPNLGLAFGTTPDLFMYMDYVPRVDLAANPEYMDKYYAELNEEHLRLHDNEELTTFISRDLYMRATQTPASICLTALDNENNMQTLRDTSSRMLDQWLANVDKSTVLCTAERQAQADRDEHLRREIALRDPMNEMVQRMYGAELSNKLVNALWGGDRLLPRPGEVSGK